MKTFKTIEIKKNILEDNNKEADSLRKRNREAKTFLLNLMSSPGSGKTSVLTRTIHSLQEELKIGVMEADIDSDVDAQTIAATGVRVIQLHTGGMCHLDADMTEQGMRELVTDDLDLVFLENVGNLVCPAEFDTGASRNVMILSVPEGDDKPLKYPLIFRTVDVMLINKIDCLEYFDFQLGAAVERARHLNPGIRVFPISAKTGEGFENWVDWLRTEVRQWKSGEPGLTAGNMEK